MAGFMLNPAPLGAIPSSVHKHIQKGESKKKRQNQLGKANMNLKSLECSK